MAINIELTQQEAEVLENYLFRKLICLKESNLEDAKCYEALHSIQKKLVKEMKK